MKPWLYEHRFASGIRGRLARRWLRHRVAQAEQGMAAARAEQTARAATPPRTSGTAKRGSGQRGVHFA